MNDMPANLLNQARASEAQATLMGVSGKGRKSIGFPVLITCMPVILACALVISLREGLPDRSGFVTKPSSHMLVPAQQASNDAEEG
jgi:hypothetical protein